MRQQTDGNTQLRLMSWRGWRQHFEARAGRPIPALEADHDYPLLPDSLKRSIAIFQLGESGGGGVVRQASESLLPGLTSDYAHAVRHFVAEEHRHANILAMCVRLMGRELLKESWTARLFVRGRRLMGLRLKILVLLAAEVVGIVFYRLVAERLPPGSMQTWLNEIVRDEQLHLEFHVAFLRSQMTSGLARLLFAGTWRALTLTTIAVVLLDHRKTLRDLHIDRRMARTTLSALARSAGKQVLRPIGSGERRNAADCPAI